MKKYEQVITWMKEATSVASDKNNRNQTQNNNRRFQKKKKNDKNPVAWWDKEYEEEIKSREKVLQIYVKNNSMKNFIIRMKKSRSKENNKR